MKTHAEIGIETISDYPSEFMAMARSITISLHENWDGSGYPKGSVGKSIPIEGKISTICDVFDALTSTRPYKTAWPINDAVAHINNHAGSHFDPELVQSFTGALPQILSIRQQYAE